MSIWKNSSWSSAVTLDRCLDHKCLTNLFHFKFYRPQRNCGQGNIFTPVCHSVHGGGVLSPGGCTLSRGGCGSGALPSQFFFFLIFSLISLGTPPWKQTQAYGQRAVGTYPTGMHSCKVNVYCSHEGMIFRFQSSYHRIRFRLIMSITELALTIVSSPVFLPLKKNNNKRRNR